MTPIVAPEPVRTLEIELARPIPGIASGTSITGQTYHRARLLVRLQTRPIGFALLDLPEQGISAAEVAAAIFSQLHEPINRQLMLDGLAPLQALGEAGLELPPMTRYLHSRQRLLEAAPFLSVIVSTRDRPEPLARCLPHLLQQHYPQFEVVVVDNAPRTSATRELLEREFAHHPNLIYVREDRPGLSWGRNAGLERATGEIVAITDDDVSPDPHWLTELVRGFGLDPNVACVTGPILARELETPAQHWIEQYGGFSKGFEERLFDLGAHRSPNPLYPYAAGTFGSGANIAFRSAVLRELGGFDVTLGTGTPAMSGEDFAAFVQIIRRGYKIAYEPGAFLYHEHHRGYAALKRQIYGYGVGLTAYLTQTVVADPRSLLEMIPRVPKALVYALSPMSGKNRSKESSYPRELTLLELKGMLYGPFAFLKSRWKRHVISQSRASKPAAVGRGVIND